MSSEWELVRIEVQHIPKQKDQSKEILKVSRVNAAALLSHLSVALVTSPLTEECFLMDASNNKQAHGQCWTFFTVCFLFHAFCCGMLVGQFVESRYCELYGPLLLQLLATLAPAA